MAKRSVKPQDLFQLKGIGQPQLSADGRFALGLVVTMQEEHDHYHYEMHLMDVTDGRTCLVEAGKQSLRSPRFSPDSKELAWILSAKDEERVCVAPVEALLASEGVTLRFESDDEETDCDQTSGEQADGNEDLVEDLVQVVFGQKKLGMEVVWSEDGKKLFVTEVESNLPEVKTYSTVYFKTDGVGLLPDVTTHFWEIDVDAAEGQRLYTREGSVPFFTVSPCAGYVAFTIQQSPETGSFASDIYRFHIGTGEVERLTQSRGPIRSVTYSPDGEFLAWIGHQESPQYGTESIWATSLKTGESHQVVLEFDRPTGVLSKGDVAAIGPSDRPRFSQDGTTLYFLAQDGGPTHLYSVDFPRGVPKRLTGDGALCISGFSVSDNGQVLFVSSTPSHPEEGYLLAGTGVRQLSYFNQKFVEEVDLAQAERIVFDGADNLPVEGWLMLPPEASGSAAPHPLVLYIHGGPHGAFGSAFSFRVQALCGAGFAVLYVNPRGSQAYGTDFAASVIGDWGGKDYIDIMNAVDKVVAEGYADGERLGVTGYSYGGFMTTWTIGHTTRFRAAAAGGCVSNLISFHGTSDIGKNWGPTEHLANVYDGFQELWQHSPLAYVQNVTTPTLLYHAEGDDRCPISQSEEYFTALRDLGKEAVFVRYPGGSHGYGTFGKPSYRIDTNQRLVEWFQQKLLGEGANAADNAIFTNA